MKPAFCPICRHQKMTATDAHGLALDECRACRGLWFDSGELREYRKQDRDTANPGRFEAIDEAPSLRCPRCDELSIIRGKAGRYVLHCCVTCRGFFVPDQNPGSNEPFKFEPLVDILIDIWDAFEGVDWPLYD